MHVYIARIIVKGLAHARDCSATNLKLGRYIYTLRRRVGLHQNLSLSRLRVGLRLHLHDFWRQDRSVRILLTTFYHMHHYTMQLLGI